MIYYKTLQVGCSHDICEKTTNKVAIACVYSEMPKVGEPLYLENSTKVGCTRKWCKEIVSNADCDKYDAAVADADQSPTAGLCCTDAETIDETTTSAKVTSTPAPTTTEAATTTPAATTTTPAAATTTPAAASTTPAQASSSSAAGQATTTPGSSGCMTEDIRNQVITTFNEKR
ncbi:unnamed protein product [Cylicostephanus goldi]|uniref:SCP domain-containing protein n=1 Tax=Cylicostephanus goldi TaxID=71465 RepID=A0A3P6TE93_CYLGO|nr:unnamed protein product [Cylicostephanus goldi]